MALWKPFRGKSTDLSKVPLHDGYIYWCIDDSSLHFDYAYEDGALHRKQVSAKTLTEFLDSTKVKHGDTLLSEILNNLFSGNYNDLTNIPEFALVATSGDYNDLLNAPQVRELKATDNGAGRVTLSFTTASPGGDISEYDGEIEILKEE